MMDFKFKTLLASLLMAPLLLPSMALAQWDFLPQSTEAQKTIVEALKKDKYQEALKLWPDAYQNTSFGSTYSGRASLNLILFKNGFQVSAIENLLSLKKPKYIHKNLISMWIKSAPETLEAWKVARVKWSNEWKKAMPARFHDLTQLHTVSYIGKKQDLSRELKAAKSIKNNLQLRTWKLWQIALWAPIHNAPEAALDILNEIDESPQTLIGKDQINLARGRTLYQMGMLNEALMAYGDIPRSSDYWMEALEEKAWTYVRDDRQDRALSELMTVNAKIFQPQVGPESFFLMDLANLMICDYAKIFKTNIDFKKRFQPKVMALTQLAKTGDHPSARRALTLFENDKYQLSTISSVLGDLPRLFHRDEFFTRHMLYRKYMVIEANQKAKLGVSDELMPAKSIASRSEDSRKGAMGRLKDLAQKELKEFSQMIQKMHLVEAEAIQRMHLDDNMKGRRTAKASDEIKSDANTLEFPFDEEVWIDELDNYNVKVKDCPKLERAAL